MSINESFHDCKTRAQRPARPFVLRVARTTCLVLAACALDAHAQAPLPPDAPAAPNAPLPGSAPRPPQPPRALPPPPPIDNVQTYSGVVRLYLLNEFGDVEGVIAQDGTQVRFPPHMSADVVRALKIGDRFTAQGNGVAGRGFRAYSLGKSGGALLVEARPSGDGGPPLPPEARAASLTQMRVDGAVASLLFAPRGDVDGVVLVDGTIVRLPPRSGLIDPATLRIGVRFAASGYGTQNAYGRSLRAEMVGLDGQAMVALQPRGPEAPLPPRGPRGSRPGLPPPDLPMPPPLHDGDRAAPLPPAPPETR